MKRKRIEIPIETLREILRYDPITGEFFWKVHVGYRGSRGQPGKRAGCKTKGGYVVLRYEDVSYLAHRVAWGFMFGSISIDIEIDHRNLNKHDNCFMNLRHTTHSNNSANASIRTNNTSGYKGVSWSKVMNKWEASVTKNYIKYNLGYFDNPEDAHVAYVDAAKSVFGQFARAA